jgi:hypothetical protein
MVGSLRARSGMALLGCPKGCAMTKALAVAGLIGAPTLAAYAVVSVSISVCDDRIVEGSNTWIKGVARNTEMGTFVVLQRRVAGAWRDVNRERVTDDMWLTRTSGTAAASGTAGAGRVRFRAEAGWFA